MKSLGYYDPDGSPLEMMEWAKMCESGIYQRVDQTFLLDHRVSTVWIGLDMNYWGGPPIIFETMVFCGDHKCGWDQHQFRYATKEQAQEGHDLTVTFLRIKPFLDIEEDA